MVGVSLEETSSGLEFKGKLVFEGIVLNTGWFLLG